MIPIGMTDIRKLIKKAGDPCVSIYQELESGRKAAENNPRKLKSLIGQATRLLGSRDMSDKDAKAMLKDLMKVADNKDLLAGEGRGLALFASPGYSACFQLAKSPMERVSVNTRYQIRPLLVQMEKDQQYFLLAFNLGKSRLFEVDSNEIQQIDLGDLPSASEFRLEGEKAGTQQHGGSGEGTDSPRSFGHGEEDKNREKAVNSYLKELGSAVKGLLAGRKDPLLLAGEESILGRLRPKLKYRYTQDEVLAGNPRMKEAEELHAQSLKIMEPILSAERVQMLEELRARQEKDGKAVADDPQEIMDAAKNGTIDTLFITADCRLFGSTKGLSEELRTNYAGVDLANQAAIWTIEKGGSVRLSTEKELGEGIQMLAGLRY